MYARITNFQFDPARQAEIEALLDGIKAEVKSVPGIVTVYSCYGADGHGVTTAIYESQADAEAASQKAQSIWAGLASLLTAPPNAQNYENVHHLSE